MSDRNRTFLFIAVASQVLNIFYIGWCFANVDYLPSVIIGGFGRIFTDGVLLYLAWKEKKWAIYFLAVLWGLVVFAGVGFGFKLVSRGDLINAFGLFGVALFYFLLIFLMVKVRHRSFKNNGLTHGN